MSSETELKRRVGLISVQDFATNLRRALSDAGLEGEGEAAVIARHISANCSACGAELAGDDLVALLAPSALPESARPNRMSLVRLRQGYCTGLRCDSRYYEFVFQPHPEIDWSLIQLSYQATEEDDVAESRSFGKMALAAMQKHLRWQFVVAVLSLWMLHQWYYGGSIPLVRPARTFTSTVTLSPDLAPDLAEE